MSKLVPPHGGGALKPLLIEGEQCAEELERAEGLKAVPMTSRESSDLVMMAMGAYTPLEGFMAHDDWRGVCLDMKLQSGVFWPIPITLSCSQDLAGNVAGSIGPQKHGGLGDFALAAVPVQWYSIVVGIDDFLGMHGHGQLGAHRSRRNAVHPDSQLSKLRRLLQG